MLIGRLITDEQFRSEFLDNAEATLINLCDRGLQLSRTEISAVVNTDPTLWARIADTIDPRLLAAMRKLHLVLAERFVERGWLEHRDDYFLIRLEVMEPLSRGKSCPRLSAR